jgi:hypothetical protein
MRNVIRPSQPHVGSETPNPRPSIATQCATKPFSRSAEHLQAHKIGWLVVGYKGAPSIRDRKPPTTGDRAYQSIMPPSVTYWRHHIPSQVSNTCVHTRLGEASVHAQSKEPLSCPYLVRGNAGTWLVVGYKGAPSIRDRGTPLTDSNNC